MKFTIFSNLASVTLSLLFSGSVLAQSIEDAIPFLKSKDYTKAFQIIEIAAIEGDAEAMTQLSAMYEQGLGVTQDIEKSMLYLEKASNKGHSQARFVLGTKLLRGSGIKADISRGFELILLSAKDKNPNAQFALCVLQSNKNYTQFDLIESYAWCKTSTTKDHENRKMAFQLVSKADDYMEKNSTVEWRAKAVARAEEYISKYGN